MVLKYEDIIPGAGNHQAYSCKGRKPDGGRGLLYKGSSGKYP